MCPLVWQPRFITFLKHAPHHVLNAPPHLAIPIHHRSHLLNPPQLFMGRSLWPAGDQNGPETRGPGVVLHVLAFRKQQMMSQLHVVRGSSGRGCASPREKRMVSLENWLHLVPAERDSPASSPLSSKASGVAKTAMSCGRIASLSCTCRDSYKHDKLAASSRTGKGW